MTIRLELGVGVLSRRAALAQAAAARLQADALRAFGDASGSDIDLTITLSSATFGPEFAGPIASDLLNFALERVTGRQRNRTQVSKIGILIADAYEPRPDFFGYMFDQSYSPGSANPWETTPREGCAIFLDGIAARRTGAALLEEAIYTAVHELGHVFNLQHSDAPSYMATSAGRATPYPSADTRFNPRERFLLAQCSTSRFIWPGGSAFGDLGPLAAGDTVANGANDDGLQLRLSMNQREFWRFEPVELDIVLSTHARAIRAPDMVDPGYKSFAVWVEEPDGARRRYRSPRHYCPRRVRVSLARGAPLARDLSIFAESGGFTFRKIGKHRLFASFALSSKRQLFSNALEVDVLPPAPSDSFFRDACALLTNRHVTQLLYYRRLTPRRRGTLGKLIALGDACPRHASTAMLRYAVGRSLATAAHAARRLGHPSARLARESAAELRVASGNTQLGEHRRERVERELQRLARL